MLRRSRRDHGPALAPQVRLVRRPIARRICRGRDRCEHRAAPRLPGERHAGGILDEVRVQLHAIVADAEAEALLSDDINEDIARLLHPRLAVAEAVDASVVEIGIHHA